MDDVIDLTPHCDDPALTTAGILYAAMRLEGHSDFVAGSFMRNAKRAEGKAVHGVEAVRDFLNRGPAALCT